VNETYDPQHWRKTVRQHNLTRPIADACRQSGFALPYTHFILLGYWPRAVACQCNAKRSAANQARLADAERRVQS
jgi:hypothetical protein